MVPGVIISLFMCKTETSSSVAMYGKVGVFVHFDDCADLVAQDLKSRRRDT